MAALALLLLVFLILQAFFRTGAWSNIPLQFWMRDGEDDSAAVS
jgi:hypothetical protein